VGAIFYEMLYGKNPFSGCNNLLELKERVKKDIVFPKYPYVSHHTKSIIRRIMVVEEKDRIDWEFLFNEFLLKPHHAPAPIAPPGGFYTMNA
jgi:serine/threonine protein kinase